MEFLRPHNPEFCRIPVFRRDIFCFLRHRRQRFPAETAHHGHRLLPQAVKENKTCRFFFLLILGSCSRLSFRIIIYWRTPYPGNLTGHSFRLICLLSFRKMRAVFVLYDKNKDQYSIYNEKMSRQRVSPDSTYKIYSALAALDAGVISPGKSEIAWDQKQYPFSSWNKDQTLDSAMSSSVNWYFQTLDKKLGKTELQKTPDASGTAMRIFPAESLLSGWNPL